MIFPTGIPPASSPRPNIPCPSIHHCTFHNNMHPDSINARFCAVLVFSWSIEKKPGFNYFVPIPLRHHFCGYQPIDARNTCDALSWARMLKIIFLDIDGVLLPFPSDSKDTGLFPPSTLQALHHLLKEATGASLVLSSTWRVRQDYIHDILQCLQDFGIDIKEFYDITDPQMHSERQWEIQAWLSKKQTQLGANETITWLALDDEDLEEGEANETYRDLFHGHAVKTESHLGLTMNDVEEALRLWRAQL